MKDENLGAFFSWFMRFFLSYWTKKSYRISSFAESKMRYDASDKASNTSSYFRHWNKYMSIYNDCTLNVLKIHVTRKHWLSPFLANFEKIKNCSHKTNVDKYDILNKVLQTVDLVSNVTYSNKKALIPVLISRKPFKCALHEENCPCNTA